jgi:hypothetical protein
MQLSCLKGEGLTPAGTILLAVSGGKRAFCVRRKIFDAAMSAADGPVRP